MAIYEIIIQFNKSEYLIHAFENETEIKRETLMLYCLSWHHKPWLRKNSLNMYAFPPKGNGFLALFWDFHYLGYMIAWRLLYKTYNKEEVNLEASRLASGREHIFH